MHRKLGDTHVAGVHIKVGACNEPDCASATHVRIIVIILLLDIFVFEQGFHDGGRQSVGGIIDVMLYDDALVKIHFLARVALFGEGRMHGVRVVRRQ